MLSDMMADLGDQDEVIPLANVNGETFSMVYEYLSRHGGESLGKTAWDDAYICAAKPEDVVALLFASEFLDIQGLGALAMQRLADLFEELPVDRIRSLLRQDF
jgi:hypothetical protein